VKLIPDLTFEYSFWSDGEPIAANEVSLTLVAEVWIVLKEAAKGPLLGSELSVLVFEHTNGAASMND
jgi:hypothetical protein